MSQSKNAVELYALLVDGTYGELACRIITILLRRGRLTVPLLAQHTNLSPRQIRHGLVVLIQQNLVYHYFDTETRLTHYEAKHRTAFALTRSGKIIEMVERRYGVSARDVMQNLFLLGNTKVADLVVAYASHEAACINRNGDGPPPLNGLNGHSKPINTSASKLDSTLIRLLSAGLVETVSESMFRSSSDTYSQVESEVLQSGFGGGAKGTKLKDEVKSKIRQRLRDIRSERQQWSTKKNPHGINGELLNTVNGNGKRRRSSDAYGAVNGNRANMDEGCRIDRDLVVRINFEKCMVLLRNQRLVEFAEKRIGNVTSRLYGELLRLLEDKLPRCRLDPRIDDVLDLADGPSVTTMELTAVLSDLPNLTLGIGKASSDKINTKTLEKVHKNKRADYNEDDAEAPELGGSMLDSNAENNDGVDHWEAMDVQELRDLEDDSFASESVLRGPKRSRVTFEDKPSKPQQFIDRQTRLNQVKDHLLLLSADDCRFLRRCGSRGFGEWTVDFEGLVERMRDTEIDLMLLENFGTNGHRLARILKKLGKLDEKQLSNFALIKQKDVRTKMVEMQIAGVVDVQEIPRDSARSAGRTIYLWFFDMDRVSKMFLDGIYKDMSRCLLRLEIERRRAKDVLELMERSDLRGAAEEDYLTPAQLNELEMFRAKEESLYGHVSRLDELVGIFRDY